MTEKPKFILRDLPGVGVLEERLARVAEHPHPDWAPDAEPLERDIEELGFSLFGLRLADTRFSGGGGMSRAEFDRAWDMHEQNFEFLYVDTDEEEAAYKFIWSAMGWDLSDGAGEELRIASRLGRQIVCATKGLAGHLPSAVSGDLSDQQKLAMQTKLAAELAEFQRRRGR